MSQGNPYSRCVCVDPLIITESAIQTVSYSSFWLAGICRRLQSYNYPTRYIRHYNFDARIDADVTPFQDSEWRIAPGLANSSYGYVSFEAVNYRGYYLKQTDYDLSLVKNDGTDAFKAAATFKKVTGLADNSGFSFQLYNDSSRYIRHYNYYLRLDPISTTLDRQDATFFLTD
ncbi:MAG: AbfB domain-containing protein [Bacillota bacterium]